jgi:hypothetical protein
MSTIAAIPSSASQSTGSRVALRADLARYEKQLADCVNCASATTPEGKRNIQDLDARISTLKAQLSIVPPADSGAAVNESRSASRSLTTGGRIDVYA